MSYPFGYRLPTLVAKYKQIRFMTLWAGGLGVAESLLMMGLTLTGILAYSCIVPAPSTTTFGSLISNTFYILYFKGDCKPDNFVEYNYTIITDVQTIQEPWQILIWESVYLGVATLWLISSILLITHVKKEDTKLTVANLSGWIILTASISVMDLILGIFFGIDYGSFHQAAGEYNYSTLNGATDPNAAQLMAAAVVAISMMFVSFKGFVLWLINVALMTYFIVQSFVITTETDGNETMFIPRQETDDVLSTHPPIIAYDEKTKAVSTPMSYSNDGFMIGSDTTASLELNQEALVRAARISTDVNLNERRFRNLDTFQQYPPPPQYSRNRAESSTIPQTATNAFPVPDYSPPMTRAN